MPTTTTAGCHRMASRRTFYRYLEHIRERGFMSGGTGRRRSGGLAAARRAPQTSAIAAAPALKIPSRPGTHIRDGGLLVAAGATGFGLAPLVGHAELQVVVLLAGVASAAVTVVAGSAGVAGVILRIGPWRPLPRCLVSANSIDESCGAAGGRADGRVCRASCGSTTHRR